MAGGGSTMWAEMDGDGRSAAVSGGEGVWRIGLPGWYEPRAPEGGKTPGKTPAVAKAVAKGASRCMGWRCE